MSIGADAFCTDHKVDSVERKLKTFTKDTEKVTYLYQITRTWISTNYHEHEILLYYATKGLQLADSIQDRQGIADMSRAVGAVYYFLNNYSKAIWYYEDALQLCLDLKDTDGSAKNYYNIGLCFHDLAKPYEALDYFLKALSFKRQLNDKLEIFHIYSVIATVYHSLGKYSESLPHIRTALNLAKETDNKTRAASFSELYALSMSHLNQMDSSVFYYKASENLYRELGDSYQVARVIYNQTNVFYQTKKWKTIVEYQLRATKIWESLDLADVPKNNLLAQAYKGISESYYSWDKLDSAIYYCEKAADAAAASTDQKIMAETYLGAGKVYFEHQLLHKAEMMAMRAEAVSADIKFDAIQSAALELLSNVYAAKGEYRKALDILHLQKTVVDSLNIKENREKFQRFTQQYEFEKARQEKDALFQMQMHTQEQTITQQKTRIWFVLIAFMLSMALLIISIMSYRRGKIANRRQKEQNEEIRNINAELFLYKNSLEDMVRQQTSKLRRNEKQLLSLSDNLSNGLVYREYSFIGKSSTIAYISNTVNKWFNVTAEDIVSDIGKLYKNINSDDLRHKLQLQEECGKKMIPYTCEYRLIKDGQEIWLLENAKPYRSKNKAIVWDGVIVDITERKQYEREAIEAKEKAEESDKLKSSFLANMSHEVRTPMNGIIGFLSFLEKDNLPVEKRRFYIEIIHNNVRQLLQIIGDILDISKLDSHQMVIHPSRIDVNKLMRETLTFYEDFIGKDEKNIELVLDDSRSIDACFIETDPTRLQQIITNLMNNAVKFTNFGYIRFGYQVTENHSGLIFFIEDSGIGISEEYKTNIFDRFRQGYDSSKHTNYHGIGLGLSISHNLVKLMGGDIWLESEEGVGSTFWFSLPLQYKRAEKQKPENQFNFAKNFEKIIV
ncbi:MAG: tetratricopeptide repeat protein [Bacteroidales bacterium]|nr:tetratricopeptide repeat protein [Bacteroidales bacterium]